MAKALTPLGQAYQNSLKQNQGTPGHNTAQVASQTQVPTPGATGSGIATAFKPPAPTPMQAPKAPPASAPPQAPQPATNYGGKGNPYNEILYSKEQYDAGNKTFAQNNAAQYYEQLDPAEKAKIQGMNTQQLRDYLNSKNGTGGNAQPGTGNIPQTGGAAYGPGTTVPQQQGYQSTYKGPDLTGMTKQINDTYANRLAAELQKLRDARDIALQGYNSQETTAKQGAYDSRNQADTINLQNEQRMNEQVANSGLTTDGQNLTLQAGQNAQRLGDIGQINRQENNALQDISQQRALLQNNAAANELGLTQQINSDQAAALFDLAKYGDTRAFDVDNQNYGRYRDDVNQQFAQDQFGFQKDQANIQNQAQYGGTYNGQQTVQQQQQNIQNQAQFGGTFGGKNTVQQDQQQWENRFNYGNAIGQFGNGQQTVQQQQQTYQKARDAISDKQWQATFDRDVNQFGMNYALQKLQANNDQAYRQAQTALQEDQNYIGYINAANKDGGSASAQTVSPTAAGQLLQQSLQKVVSTDQFTGKPTYGTITDPGAREKAFVDAWNASGVAPGADTIEMLSKAGYTPAEIQSYKKNHPEAFNSGTAASGSYGSKNVSIPRNLQGLSVQLGSKYNVDPALIDAVAQQESGYGGSSKNVMQVNGLSDSSPGESMEAGSRMLGNYMQQTGNNLEMSLAMYNMGPGIRTWMQKNGITDVRQGMKEFSAYQKQKNGYKVYGDPSYLDHVLRYYK